MPSQSIITPKTFAFLRELAKHNERDWFNANKERYHETVRDPLLEFIETVAPKLEKISPFIAADSRPVGGSLFRVYRDTRFSKDKRPYKTYAGMSLRHVHGREVPAPGFYLHIEPGRIFSAAGIWHTPPDGLKQIRDAILAHPQRWKRIAKTIDDGNDTLKRAPRGYDPDHPLVEDLKRKSFTRSTTFSQKDVCAADFPSRFVRACRQSSPLMAFLSEAVGVDW